MSTQTMNAPTVRSSALLADLTDTDEWCICRRDNPDIALCGAALEGIGLPDAEVPDELTCPECRMVWEESANDDKLRHDGENQ